MICSICNLDYHTLKGLSSHIRIHNIKVKEYYDKFLKKDKEGKCKICGEETNFIYMSSGYRIYCSTKCMSNDSDIQNVKNYTCIEKYGVKNQSQSKEVQEKYKQTMIERYGAEYPNQIEEVKEKSKQTCLEKYGVEHPSQTKEFQEKKKNECLKKHGVESTNQIEEVKNKIKETCIEKYGFDNFSKTDEGRKFHREIIIKRIEQQKLNGEPLTPCIGRFERICLNELENLIQYKILRNEKCIGFFIDGYIKELNIAIEFDESFHFVNGILSNKDIKRQKILEYELKCEFFRIKESDWIENKDCIINSFLEKVKQYECRSN